MAKQKFTLSDIRRGLAEGRRTYLELPNSRVIATMNPCSAAWGDWADNIVQACNAHAAREKLIKDLAALCEKVFTDLNKERDTYSEPRLIELCRVAIESAKEKGK